MQDGGFGLADVLRDVLVAAGLADLLFQALQLGVQRDQHIVQSLKVVLRRAQAQFGLVAARMQAGDAGSFLDQQAAVARLGVDQRADAALADQRRRTRACGLVGEQDLHIACAHVATVHAIGRALLALDAAGDFQLVGIVELAGGGTVGVVEAEEDFRGIARGAVGGAAEDNVVHRAAAHLLGRGLAHDPAQRLDKVGLAAAVRADDTRQARFDHQIGSIDEGLEARQSELVEMHRCVTP